MLPKYCSQLNKVCFNRASLAIQQSDLSYSRAGLADVSTMPSLHGFQIKGGRAMSSPVALITGALTGIGRATALAFAKEGARVVISGRRDEEGKESVAELRKLGAEAEFVRSDVRHEEDVRNLVDKT